MGESDPFRGAVDRPEQLREFYDSPMEAAIRKDIGKLDELCRRLIAAAPMLFVATFSPEGQAIAALGVVVPRSSEFRPGLAPMLLAAARGISRVLSPRDVMPAADAVFPQHPPVTLPGSGR